jgi:cytochrome P450 family 49 subfamily A
MKQIAEAMDRLSPEECERSEDDMSIVQKIIRKTSNPKMAAVLALDLLLVGVDTVSTLATHHVLATLKSLTCFGAIV